MRKSERIPTPAGVYVLGRMADLKMKQQVDLVRAAGLSDSTVSRVIYTAGYSPDHDTFEKLARGLRVNVEDLARYFRSGAQSAKPAVTAVGEYENLIEDVRLALSDDSPLSTEERARRAEMIDLVIDPVRKQIQRMHRAI